MLNHPTLDKLQALKLGAMARGLAEQMENLAMAELTFEERLGLLADRELTARDNRRMTGRLRGARLRLSACLEDIDYRATRGLDRGLLAKLADCQWVQQGYNVLVTGPTGAGKTYLACALAQKACRDGYTSLYVRMPRLFEDLQAARGDGTYPKLLANLARKHVLVLDDWGLAPLTDENRRDLLEIVEDRYDGRSTVIASQLPVEHWHDKIGDSTLADAILDRIVHKAYKVKLKGGSMRKGQGPESPPE
ncbi:MAG TPA: AAA family ATPase [Arthrobacter bacterium]|nr:AAA family ATPase [Arthrobacter sp.]